MAEIAIDSSSTVPQLQSVKVRKLCNQHLAHPLYLKLPKHSTLAIWKSRMLGYAPTIIIVDFSANEQLV
jgi:hypothetical protein